MRLAEFHSPRVGQRPQLKPLLRAIWPLLESIGAAKQRQAAVQTNNPLRSKQFINRLFCELALAAQHRRANYAARKFEGESRRAARLVQPLGRERENLDPGLGDRHRVLELGGERAVADRK